MEREILERVGEGKARRYPWLGGADSEQANGCSARAWETCSGPVPVLFAVQAFRRSGVQEFRR